MTIKICSEWKKCLWNSMVCGIGLVIKRFYTWPFHCHIRPVVPLSPSSTIGYWQNGSNTLQFWSNCKPCQMIKELISNPSNVTCAQLWNLSSYQVYFYLYCTSSLWPVGLNQKTQYIMLTLTMPAILSTNSRQRRRQVITEE